VEVWETKLFFDSFKLGKSMKKILVVVGTRPNFIKVTQFKRVAEASGFDLRIVHTGQHFDDKMADVFFRQFELKPDYFLNLSAKSSPNTQIAEIMLGLEKLIENEFQPDLMIVVGDVNSTLAGALTANKMKIRLAHLESGLRSFDNTMPEEFNRVVADRLSDFYFVTEQSGMNNLVKENVDGDSIFFVGNTMIDTMVAFEKQIEESSVLNELNIEPKKYVLMTMHRPATVDEKAGLEKLLDILTEIRKKHKIVFPVHPRTIKNIEAFGLKEKFNALGIIFTEPLDYFSFQKLVKHCSFILTDSGGIQEESTFLRIPCLTLRPNTERPVTCTLGTNTLVPFELNTVLNYIDEIETGTYKKGEIPPMWDGKATERIFQLLKTKRDRIFR
jgi:UDP-N-acetylglucosamine 2-epimerase (non-hydrolysing)